MWRNNILECYTLHIQSSSNHHIWSYHFNVHWDVIWEYSWVIRDFRNLISETWYYLQIKNASWWPHYSHFVNSSLLATFVSSLVHWIIHISSLVRCTLIGWLIGWGTAFPRFRRCGFWRGAGLYWSRPCRSRGPRLPVWKSIDSASRSENLRSLRLPPPLFSLLSGSQWSHSEIDVFEGNFQRNSMKQTQ